MSETPYLSFVVYDSQGKEVDRVDPCDWYMETKPGQYKIDNGFYVYNVGIPEGGRHELKWVVPDDGVEVERR